MLLAVGKGPLRKGLRAALRRRGVPIVVSSPRAEDLFERACNSGTLIYAPAANLLRGSSKPRPDPERMRTVVGAANAPGCSTLVVVVPAGGGYDAELEVLRKSGKPYVIVSAPPLVEEVGAEIAESAATTLWVPKSGSVIAVRARRVARAALAAAESEYQGRVEPVEGEPMDVAELFRRAAEVAHVGVRVRAAWPPLYRVVRPVARWLRGGEPRALALAASLAQPSGAAPPDGQNAGA